MARRRHQEIAAKARRAGVGLLKRLRAIEPLNRAVTVTVRAVLRSLQLRDDFAVKHLPRMGTTRLVLPNDRVALLRSRGDDWISNQVFWRGWSGYEPETTRVFWQLALSSRLTLDVGAHVGFHSIVAALANEASLVYAFEPLPAVFDRLERNLSINGLRNVVATRAAAGAHDGDADFFHVPDVIPSSSSLSAEFMRGTPGVTSVSVPVVRLDSFLAEHGEPSVDLVKIDTETGELDALSGMVETLRRCQPDIVCEVLTRSDGDALTRLLAPLGYEFHLLTDRGPQQRSAVIGDPQWLNYLFTARGSPR